MLSFFIQMNGSLVLVPGVERNSSHLGISDPPRISASHDTLIALGVHTSFSSIPINISVIDSFCQFSSLSTKTELEQRQAILPNSYHPAVLCILHLPSLHGDHLHVQPHVGPCHLVLSQGPCLVRADDTIYPKYIP